MQDAKWSGYSSTRALPLQSLHHYVWTVWGVAPEEPTAAIPHGGVCEEREGPPSRLLGHAASRHESVVEKGLIGSWQAISKCSLPWANGRPIQASKAG